MKLVQKSGYIKNNKAGGYMMYIATREGVELHTGFGAATKKQTALIAQLLHDYPDSTELFEFSDYQFEPNAENASAFITAALDTNAHSASETDGYMKYIALRPRAERHGEHGLFGDADNVDLDKAMRELSAHQGNVWTIIYSLRREDAARLRYDNAAAWRTLLRANAPALADAIKIPADKLHWYAAFHNEGHHPHIHMMVWSDDAHSKGYLTTSGIAAMRSTLTNVIFKDDRIHIYEQKDIAYKMLTGAAQKSMDTLRNFSNDGVNDNRRIETLMQTLASQLANVTGKLQYGYLPKAAKQTVDEIVDELSTLPEVADCYADWSRLRDEIASYYNDKRSEPLPLSQQKELKAIKNIVVRQAVALGEMLSQVSTGTEDDDPELDGIKAVLHDAATPPAEKRAALFKLHTYASHGNAKATYYTDVSGLSRVTELTYSATCLLKGLADVFGSSIPPSNPKGFRANSKRRKILMGLRDSHGHRLDDHYEYNEYDDYSMKM